MAPIWEKQCREQFLRRHAEYEAELQDYHFAREKFARDSAKVNEWVRQREAEGLE